MISDRNLKLWRKDALLLRVALAGWDSLTEFTKERRKMAVRICELTRDIEDERVINQDLREKNKKLEAVQAKMITKDLSTLGKVIDKINNPNT